MYKEKPLKEIQKIIDIALSQETIHEFYPYLREFCNIAIKSDNRKPIYKAMSDSFLKKFDSYPELKTNTKTASSPSYYTVLTGNKALICLLYFLVGVAGNKDIELGEKITDATWHNMLDLIRPEFFSRPSKPSPFTEEYIYDVLDTLNDMYGFSDAVISPNDKIIILDDENLEGASILCRHRDEYPRSVILLNVPSNDDERDALLFRELATDLLYKYSEGTFDLQYLNDFKLDMEVSENDPQRAYTECGEILGVGLAEKTPYKFKLPQIEACCESEEDSELFAESLEITASEMIQKTKNKKTIKIM